MNIGLQHGTFGLRLLCHISLMGLLTAVFFAALSQLMCLQQTAFQDKWNRPSPSAQAQDLPHAPDCSIESDEKKEN